jgi:DNA-binding IclR family transcriptional regulator
LTSIDGLLSDIRSAREDSFAFDNEEYTPGVVCFAMPFKNIAGQTLGAISISLPSELKDEINRDRVLTVLEEASSKIAKSLVVSPVKSHHQSVS